LQTRDHRSAAGSQVKAYYECNEGLQVIEKKLQTRVKQLGARSSPMA
jgi:hypothetical protein